jgi:uncharacterized protein YjbI with pentapeptide repeats
MAGRKNARAALICLSFAASLACAQTAPAPDQKRLETRKLENEVRKLQEEITGLQNANATPGRVLTWIQAIGFGTVGALIAGLAGLGLHSLRKQQLQQDIDISRSEHNLKLFEALGSAEPRIRVGAVSELAQRARTAGAVERQTILRVLIGVTKHEDGEELQKHIADAIVEVVAACNANLETPAVKLSDFNFQGARLTNAWWKGVDARDTDFYRAQLARAGLAESNLQGAVFKNSDLSEATLRKANARGANFEGANMTRVKGDGICLEGANLKGAILVGADLRNADVKGADFSKANLRHAKVQGVDFNTANVTDAELPQ